MKLIRKALGNSKEWKIGAEILQSEYKVNFKDLLNYNSESKVGLIALSDDLICKQFDLTLKALGVEGRYFNPFSNNFHEEVLSNLDHIFICRPGHQTNLERQLFWEKIVPLYNLKNFNAAPSRQELIIYEAKRELSYFLKIHKIPHPETNVFTNFEDASSFVSTCKLPQIFKTNTGAGSTGIEIINTRKQLRNIVNEMFKKFYIKKSIYDFRDIDYNYLILQEYLTPVREFRVIKIGKSWFGHEKLPGKGGPLMSGSGLNAWTEPPAVLLDFCLAISEKFSFETMCFDVFLDKNGEWLVNELQCWFGSYDNSQMYIDGVPGRFIKNCTGWEFETGYFNELCSFPLIIGAALEKYRNQV